jgi:hypothetical protein
MKMASSSRTPSVRNVHPPWDGLRGQHRSADAIASDRLQRLCLRQATSVRTMDSSLGQFRGVLSRQKPPGPGCRDNVAQLEGEGESPSSHSLSAAPGGAFEIAIASLAGPGAAPQAGRPLASQTRRRDPELKGPSRVTSSVTRALLVLQSTSPAIRLRSCAVSTTFPSPPDGTREENPARWVLDRNE